MCGRVHENMEGIRIDKWLWAVRVYKTRSIATDACRNGKVKVGGHAVKPSHEVKEEEVIEVHLHSMTKTLKVRALLKNRVSASLAPDYMEDAMVLHVFPCNGRCPGKLLGGLVKSGALV